MTDLIEAARRLTETQRALAAECLSKAERRFLLAALANDYPAVFDALLADMNSRPRSLEEVTL